jgi:rhodanese-related sulfurtransferase
MAEAAILTVEPERGRILRGVLAILATGLALGFAFNALGLASHPQKGLAWIAEEKHLDTLEAAKAGGAPPPTAQAAADLPAIPDVGRPLQTDLSGTKKFFDAKAALFIDAREPEEYAAGHIPGAMSLPGDAAITDPAALEKIDSGGKPIVVYCGGGACELSMNLAFALVQAGHQKVLVYTGGFPEWQGAALPVETGAGTASR